jgi:hypothetical protein
MTGERRVVPALVGAIILLVMWGLAVGFGIQAAMQLNAGSTALFLIWLSMTLAMTWFLLPIARGLGRTEDVVQEPSPNFARPQKIARKEPHPQEGISTLPPPTWTPSGPSDPPPVKADQCAVPLGEKEIPCPKCRTLAEEGTMFCKACGSPLAEAWKSADKKAG